MSIIVPFTEKLAQARHEADSLLCVGLDPDPDRLPACLKTSSSIIDATRRFCLQIIESTAPYASAFKVNFAFFEALGPEGWRLLKEVSDEIPRSKISVADAKRGDIGNTGRFYAAAVFEQLGFDACTVSPYMGKSSVWPFLQHPGKAAIVLARTSNRDAEEMQMWPSSTSPLFRHVARLVRQWASDCPGTAGLVVGATDMESFGALRREWPDATFLVPGIGAQGGDLASVIRVGMTGDGGLMINSSRSVIYASDDDDFAEAAGSAASALRDEMREALTA